MCGFLCVVTRGPLRDTVDVENLNRDVLRHRGPDSSGELLFGNAYVRHWRLSIVDLSRNSSQPYGDGGSWLIYNGEIYNYAEIAARLSLEVTGDTPLVYELCRQGIDAVELQRARGFYSYLYLSGDGLSLAGARDPFGKKPLFYHIDNQAGIAVFASEEKAIVDCLRGAAIDFAALGQYLLYKQLFHGATCFRDIRQLAPGARFRFDARTWTFTVDREWTDYYDMPAAEVFGVSPWDAHGAGRDDEIDAHVAAELRASLVLRIPREVPACIALSGGVDSALMARLTADASLLDRISEFVTVGFEEPASDESSRAAQIAAAVAPAARHAVVPFRQDDMLDLLRECVAHAAAPLEHPHYLSYFVLCRHASRTAKVLVTGEGADELFMGYEHYRAGGASFAFREYLTAEDEAAFDGPAGASPFDHIRRDAGIARLRRRASSSRMQARESELKTHLLTLLTRNDKMGMASSVEVRAPFLDREIVALSLGLSDADLVVEGTTKRVLKRLFAAGFPGMTAQPRKIGFRVPFDEMFLSNREGAEIRRFRDLAARALREECGLTLRSPEAIAPRLGWSLLNIGMFLESHGY